MADFGSVAELTVTACTVVGRVHTRIGGFVTGIGGTRNAVVAVHRGSGLAAERGMTDFRAVAILPIAAGAIAGGELAGIRGFVAGVGGAAHAVIANHGRPRLAALRGMAGFGSVAVQPIAANAVDRRMDAGIGRLVARVSGAGDAVIAIGGSARLTTQRGVTGFHAIAPQAVIAKAVTWLVDAVIARFVAGIDRTSNVIVAISRCSRLAPVNGMADFVAVAPLPVAAGRMVGGMGAGISPLVAGIHGAGNAVGTIDG